MRIIFRILIIASLFGIMGPLVSAESTIDPMSLPKLTQHIEDFSNTLSVQDLDSLCKIARDYEAKTTHQMVVVLFPDRNGNELFDIGMRIFQDNKIGQVGKDNGVLLVIATNEKKIRIITGYGLEGDIPDVLASDIIEKDVRPLVNDGKLADAIRAFFTRVDHAIGTDEGKNLQKEADQEGIQITSVIALLFGVAFSFNIFFLGFAFFFFAIASFSIGSIYPIIAFVLGSVITTYVGFHYFSDAFRKSFFEKPKNNGNGWSGGSWGWGSSWWWSGGFSWGWGSSGGGGAWD